jgi:hypothetical protein
MVQKPGQDRSKPGGCNDFRQFPRKVDAKETLGSASANTPPAALQGPFESSFLADAAKFVAAGKRTIAPRAS